MNIFYAIDQLGHVISGLGLCHNVAALEDMDKWLPGTVLQDDIDVVTVLEVLKELYYIFVS